MLRTARGAADHLPYQRQLVCRIDGADTGTPDLCLDRKRIRLADHVAGDTREWSATESTIERCTGCDQADDAGDSTASLDVLDLQTEEAGTTINKHNEPCERARCERCATVQVTPRTIAVLHRTHEHTSGRCRPGLEHRRIIRTIDRDQLQCSRRNLGLGDRQRARRRRRRARAVRLVAAVAGRRYRQYANCGGVLDRLRQVVIERLPIA